MLIGFGTWCSYMELSRKSVGCPWNRGPQNWKFYSMFYRDEQLRCETSSLWCCRRQTFARIEMHSIAPYEWWTMVNPNLIKIVFSALFCTQCLNLFDAIASPLYNCTSVWPPDWRRPGLDLSRGNIPESCVDMRGGVSFLVFLLPLHLAQTQRPTFSAQQAFLNIFECIKFNASFQDSQHQNAACKSFILYHTIIHISTHFIENQKVSKSSTPIVLILCACGS